MKTAGNTILITGGTSGIGLALTKRFYNLNNSIIVLSQSTERLKQLKHELPKIQTIQCDLASPKSLRNVTEELERIKNINILSTMLAYNTTTILVNWTLIHESAMKSL